MTSKTTPIQDDEAGPAGPKAAETGRPETSEGLPGEAGTAERDAAVEAGKEGPAEKDGLPAGFDPWLYLALNPDVAAEYGTADAAERHFLAYGRAEFRGIRPEGQGLDHPGSRLLSPAQRSDWLGWLAQRRHTESLEDILDSHPRSGWLDCGFSLASYLVQRQDVAAAVPEPLVAALHFLEFGLEEGLLGRPDDWDPGFVQARYDLGLDEELGPVEALAALVRAGVSPRAAALTEREYWALHGLYGHALAGIFDHEYYHAQAARTGNAPASHARLDCIDHFLAEGIGAGLPVHPDRGFVASFYAGEVDPDRLEGLLFETEAGTAAGTDEAGTEERSPAQRIAAAAPLLYRHWLSAGLRGGLAPNLKAWAQQHFDLRVPDALIDQLPVYRLASPDLAETARPVETLNHLLTQPRPALAAIDICDAELLDLVVTLADRITVSGDLGQGEWLYWQALDADVGNGRALRHLSDLLQRQNRLEQVQVLRARVPRDASAGWNMLALAEVSIDHFRFEQAASLLSELRPIVRSDVVQRARRRELAYRLFDRIWSRLGPHVAAYGIETTQAQLRAALEACTPEFGTAQRSGPVRRVALVGNDDIYQCKLYRVDQKAEHLRAAGYEVTIFSPNRDMERFTGQVENFDAVIFFRVPAFPRMIEAVAAAAQHGLLTFYEIDDLIFDPEHFPPPLESYSGGLTEPQYAAMACGVPLFEHAMTLCDYGIASTGTIAALMEGRVRSGRVFEHRNALGQMHMIAMRDAATRQPDDGDRPLVVFYGSGTLAHKEDFHDILEPALAALLKAHPGRVEIRLIGNFGGFKHLDPKDPAVRMMEPVWDFEEFCSLVAEADINLAVLTPTPLTDAKSEIKWMEAAMFGIPSIVSDTATYREVIEDGETGLICRTREEFSTALERLVSDPGLRRRIGGQAREKVLNDYSIERMGQNLCEIFEGLHPSGKPAKRRLMVVNVFYPPQAIGGATRVVHDNVRLLRERYGDRYEIDVVCTLEGGQVPLELGTYAEDGVRVWTITAPSQEMGDMHPRDSRPAEVFARLVAQLKPELVHFHCIQRLTASVVDVARHRGIPYLITLHDGWWISPNQFIIDDSDRVELYDYARRQDPDFPSRARALWRPLLGAARLLPVSESFADLHREAGLDNITTVENGVSWLPECHREPSPSGRVRLAHIGGASRHKGVHLVRNALLANAYEHLELLLIDHALAPGTERREVWGTTPVTVAAKMPQSRIAELYGRTDVLLAPSIWPESYGLVVREALATGAWAVASDRGAIGSDIAEGENGFRVDVSNYEGLARALWTIDRDHERYLRAPDKAPEIRTAADQADALAALYEEVLADAAKG